MNEFFNWHDTAVLWSYHWYWLLLALILGGWVGYNFNTWKNS